MARITTEEQVSVSVEPKTAAGRPAISTSRRRILRRLAMQSPEVFFNGMTVDDFEELVADAGFGVHVHRVNGTSSRCLATHGSRAQ